MQHAYSTERSTRYQHNQSYSNNNNADSTLNLSSPEFYSPSPSFEFYPSHLDAQNNNNNSTFQPRDFTHETLPSASSLGIPLPERNSNSNFEPASAPWKSNRAQKRTKLLSNSQPHSYPHSNPNSTLNSSSPSSSSSSSLLKRPNSGHHSHSANSPTAIITSPRASNVNSFGASLSATTSATFTSFPSPSTTSNSNTLNSTSTSPPLDNLGRATGNYTLIQPAPQWNEHGYREIQPQAQAQSHFQVRSCVFLVLVLRVAHRSLTLEPWAFDIDRHENIHYDNHSQR